MKNEYMSMLTPRQRKGLRDELSRLFPDVSASKLVLSNTGIPIASIEFEAEPGLNWVNIIAKAEEMDMLTNLIEGALLENDSSTFLRDLNNQLGGDFTPAGNPDDGGETSHLQASASTPENDVETVINMLKDLIMTDKVGDAIQTLRDFSKAADLSSSFENQVLMISGQHTSLKKSQSMGVINLQSALVQENKIRYSLLSLVDGIKREIEIGNKLRSLDLDTANFVPSDHHLREMQKRSNVELVQPEDERERIIGPRSNLVSKKWLVTGLKISESVGRIYVEGYGYIGTGFLLKNGYVMTNHHVLSDKGLLPGSFIEFNFTQENGDDTEKRDMYRFQFLPDVYFSSPYAKGGKPTPGGYDYAVVKIQENGKVPIRNLGFVDFEPDAIPNADEPVNIIQHPGGDVQKFALTANEVIDTWDNYIYYKADTEKGSSGAPVFNQNWKVVALHHAGRNAEDYSGGLKIRDKTVPSNRGILIRYILEDLKKKGWIIEN